MKKFVALIAMLVATLTLTVPVRAETAEDVIPQIIEVITESPTEEDWDSAVMWSQNHPRDWQSDEVKSIDQIADLIGMLEDCRKYAIEDHHNIIGEGGHLGIGIWEKDAEKMEAVKRTIDVLVKAFNAKTGVRVFFEKERERPEDGYVLWRFYTKEEPYYEKHPVTTIGQSAYAKWNNADGRYYESAWGGGSGMHGYIGNEYVFYNQKIEVIGVAYINDNNEVVEVVDEPGATIDTNRKRRLLAKTETTLLGWFDPKNLVT